MLDYGTAAIITGSAVVLSQSLNIVYNLLSQKQKDNFEIRKASILKKIDIGENVFHTFRESIINIKRQLAIGNHLMQIESPKAKIYLDAQQNLGKSSVEKLMAESSKFNLAELYFDIESTTEILTDDLSLIISNNITLLELEHTFSECSGEALEFTMNKYNELYKSHQSYLEIILARQNRDLITVKKEILKLSLLIENISKDEKRNSRIKIALWGLIIIATVFFFVLKFK